MITLILVAANTQRHDANTKLKGKFMETYELQLENLPAELCSLPSLLNHKER